MSNMKSLEKRKHQDEKAKIKQHMLMLALNKIEGTHNFLAMKGWTDVKRDGRKD